MHPDRESEVRSTVGSDSSVSSNRVDCDSMRWTPYPSFSSILEPLGCPAILFEQSTGRILALSRSFIEFIEGREAPDRLSDLNRLFRCVMPKPWVDPPAAEPPQGSYEACGWEVRWCYGSGNRCYLALQLNLLGLVPDTWGTTLFQLPPEPIATVLQRLLSEAGPGTELESGRLLSARERQVLGLVRLGYTAKAIGTLLGLSSNTVAVHRYNIRQKLGLRNLRPPA